MNTRTTRRKLTPEFKAKVVIEALIEQSTLVDIANLPNLATIRPNSTLNDIRCRILHLETPNIL